MPNIGFQELLVILVIVVFMFGGKKIPELAKSLGSGIKNFKNAMKSEEEKPDSTPTPEATTPPKVAETTTTVTSSHTETPKA